MQLAMLFGAMFLRRLESLQANPADLLYMLETVEVRLKELIFFAAQSRQ